MEAKEQIKDLVIAITGETDQAIIDAHTVSFMDIVESYALPKESRACPCLYGTPCDERCTCVNLTSSRGCQNCCTYGGVEQRTQKAEHLKSQLSTKDLPTVCSNCGEKVVS